MNILEDKINMVVSCAEKLKPFSKGDCFYEIKKEYINRKIKEIVENDFLSKNPEELLNEYVQYFKQKNIPTIKIKNGKEYYRGRVGYKSLFGSDGDLNRNFILPYYGKDIMAPPPLLSLGSRFNREGTSYLYLSDNIETCMAEIHSQVGQLCSIGIFKCKNEIEIIDLTTIRDNIEMEVWLGILTQPVYGDIHNIYNITKFLADVLKKINENGIMFKSVQSSGINIVCYKPDSFELVRFSEKLYSVKKIGYTYEPFKDSIEQYANRNKTNLSTYNEAIENKHEEENEYMEEWIEFRRKTKNDKKI